LKKPGFARRAIRFSFSDSTRIKGEYRKSFYGLTGHKCAPRSDLNLEGALAPWMFLRKYLWKHNWLKLVAYERTKRSSLPRFN